MSVAELSIGQLLKGTIRRLTDKALFIDISGSVDGVVHPLHYADIRLKHPEKRFKVGSTVKARVLDLEVARGRVILTLKKTLVDSALPVVGLFEDVKQGLVMAGTVMKLLDKGVVVELFGGLKAFVPQSEARSVSSISVGAQLISSENFTRNLSEIFYLGQPTQLRIIELQPETQRLVGSIRQASAAALAAAALEIGQEVTGQVTQIHAEQVVITLQPSQATALLSLSNLSNHRHMTIDEIRSSLKVGEKMEGLRIISQNDKNGLFKVSYTTNPSSLSVQKAGAGASAVGGLTWRDVQVGQSVPGKIVKHSLLAAAVQVGGLRGRLHATNIADDFSAVSFPQTPEGPLAIGDDVQCVILKVNPHAKQLELSTRPSRVQGPSAPEVADPEINSVAELEVGKKYRGFVKNVAGGGVFVALGSTVTARVMIKELFDDVSSGY
jgi:rRNA biogenesis protein RRP5